MSTVGTTTFTEEGDLNYFTLFNEEYNRQLSIGSNWTQLLIGVSMAIEATSSSKISGSLWIGLGPSANGVGVGKKEGFASIKRMGGVILGNTLGRTLGYSYISASYRTDTSGSYVDLGNGYDASFSGSSATKQASNGVTILALLPTTESPPRKGMFGMYVQRVTTASVQFTGLPMTKFTGSNNHNYTNNSLYSSMQATTLVTDNVSQGSISTVVLAGSDETACPLDTVNIYWTGSVPIRIYNIVVGKLS